MRLKLPVVVFVCALVSCNSAGLQNTLPTSLAQSPNFNPSPSKGEVTSGTCAQRVNDTLGRIEECMTRRSLWHHLKQFQIIADEHPGPLGHGNRNTGTSGYKASVHYVAELMREAGYHVTVQAYKYETSVLTGAPVFAVSGKDYAYENDWFVARLSGAGALTASVEPPSGSPDGCSPDDFANFKSGTIALLRRGACDVDTQIANAQAAGAVAAILYDDVPDEGAFEARLTEPVTIPVIGMVSNAVGAELLRQYAHGAASVRIEVRRHHKSDIDYNVIADSPYGDPKHVVAIDAHLDSIYGAGMLDNASGSTTILEIGLNMAKTRTRNRLRYIWFGGEETRLARFPLLYDALDEAAASSDRLRRGRRRHGNAQLRRARRRSEIRS